MYVFAFPDIASQTMAIAAVMVASLFNGMNTNVWTGWVFFAVFLGIVLVWVYTVSQHFVHTCMQDMLNCILGGLFYNFSRLVRHWRLR